MSRSLEVVILKDRNLLGDQDQELLDLAVTDGAVQPIWVLVVVTLTLHCRFPFRLKLFEEVNQANISLDAFCRGKLSNEASSSAVLPSGSVFKDLGPFGHFWSVLSLFLGKESVFFRKLLLSWGRREKWSDMAGAYFVPALVYLRSHFYPYGILG